MHQSVIDAWFHHSAAYEGRVATMYLDILGLVTTGQGNLIDTVAEALGDDTEAGVDDAG